MTTDRKDWSIFYLAQSCVFLFETLTFLLVSVFLSVVLVRTDRNLVNAKKNVDLLFMGTWYWKMCGTLRIRQ